MAAVWGATFPSHADTIAHWNFEQDLVDSSVVSGGGYGHTLAQGVFQAAASDLSGNENHLSAWDSGSLGVNHSDEVYAQNRAYSTRSVKNAGVNCGWFMTQGALELGGDTVGALQDWTIEASAKFSSATLGQYITILGMDGEYGFLAPLYLQKTNAEKFRVLVTDDVGSTEIISEQGVSSENWYQLVVVNDASADTMKLYVNGQLAGTTTAKTLPAFTSGSSGANPWAISVGRGLYKNLHSDRLQGGIDDIRISNTALAENEFLQNLDNDGDGIPDSWELQFDGVTTLADLDGSALGDGEGAGSGDFDGDGLSDLAEYQAGAKPNDKDSDGDGLEDGVEVLGSANPFLNGVKRLVFNAETDPPGDPTSPASDDSDGDGCKDNLEMAFGTDPNDGASEPPSLQEVSVFSFFRSNGQNGVYLAYTRDGLTWTELNGGNVVLTPPPGTLTRDPHITRGKDGKFHMVWTTNWSGTDMGYAYSDDLVNWSEPQILDVMGSIPNAENVWAPEMIYDEANDHYTIFWSSRVTGTFDGVGRQYQTTTKDFVTFTQAELFYEPGWDVIDASIIEVGDGSFGMFVKDERNPGKSLHYATSLNESGPYTIPVGPALFGGAAGGGWAEGPSAVKLGGTWYLYWDYYQLGYYGVATSTDLVNWTEQTSSLTMPSGIRHGTMFTMPSTEFDALFFPPVPVGEPAVMSHRYDFSEDVTDSIAAANGVLVNSSGNSNFANGSLTLGNDGTQFGANADHVVLPANLLSNLGDSVSIEIWATVTSSNRWQRLFDFGEGDDGSGVSDYNLFLTPDNNSDSFHFGYRNGATNIERNLQWLTADMTPLNSLTHVVVTWDGENDVIVLYMNGVEVSSDYDPHFDVSEMADLTNYLGRSRWSADAGLVGAFDELRLWKGVLTPSEVSSHFANGPDATPAARDHDDDGLADSEEYAIINFSANDGVVSLEDVSGDTHPSGATDFDNDGHSDAEEIALGTSSVDSNSRFTIESFSINSSTQNTTLNWNTEGYRNGVEFQVDRSSDLSDWVTIATAIPIQGATTSFTDTDKLVQTERVFYRVRAVVN